MGDILHLAPIAPALHGNGLAMRTGLLTQAAARCGNVTVVVLAETVPQDAPDAIETHHISTSDRYDTRLAMIMGMPPGPERARQLSLQPLPPGSASLSAPVTAEVAKLARQGSWDAVLISRADLLPLIDVLPRDVPVFVDLDDDDSRFHTDTAKASCGDGQTWHFAIAKQYRGLIETYKSRVCLWMAASQDVVTSLRAYLPDAPLVVVANAIAQSPSAPQNSAKRDGVCFVGNLSYAPNFEGLNWFSKMVWPSLRSLDPSVTVTVAGSRPSAELTQMCHDADLSIIADPDSLESIYARAAVAIVPLLSGSGTRIKILEAGAFGVPVVSTSNGAEGLSLVPDRHLLIADTPHRFADACLRTLRDRDAAAARAKSLKSHVAHHYDQATRIAEVASIIAGSLSGSRTVF